MYSLDIHSGHRNMADTNQVGKCGLYTSFNPEKSNQNNKATSTVSFSNHENRVQYKSHNGLLTITIHKLNFFSHLTHFLSNIFSFYVVVTKAVLMTKLSPYRNKPRLRCSYQNQNQETDLIPFAPCKKIRIPEPGRFLLGESRIWDRYSSRNTQTR